MKLADAERSSILEHFRRQPDVVAVYAFGSTVRGTATAASDLDLAVVLDSTVPERCYASRLEKLRTSLDHVGPREVDLILMNEASSFMKHHVLQRGELIYERSGRQGRRFEAAALTEFFDYEPLYARMMKSFTAAIRRGEI